MSKTKAYVFALGLLTTAALVWDDLSAETRQMEAGSESIRISVPFGDDRFSMHVFYYIPKDYRADTPIVFIMHGLGRNAADYRDAWRKSTQDYNLLILAPEFTRDDFPKSRSYNLGNVFAENGSLNPSPEWSFSAIDHIFKSVVDKIGSSCSRYNIYGHSAGAQFVHRMILLSTNLKVDTAIAANAGWYTLPDLNEDWPYGLKGTLVNENRLRGAFHHKLFLLLGSEDNDPSHKHLRRTKEANAQGPHRLARGSHFFTMARQAATQLDTPNKWELEIVDGAGHSNRKMSRAAARLMAAHARCN